MLQKTSKSCVRFWKNYEIRKLHHSPAPRHLNFWSLVCSNYHPHFPLKRLDTSGSNSQPQQDQAKIPHPPSKEDGRGFPGGKGCWSFDLIGALTVTETKIKASDDDVSKLRRSQQLRKKSLQEATTKPTTTITKTTHQHTPQDIWKRTIVYPYPGPQISYFPLYLSININNIKFMTRSELGRGWYVACVSM